METREVTVPGIVELPEPSGSNTLHARVVRDACWSPEITIDGAASSQTVSLWKAAWIEGTFRRNSSRADDSLPTQVAGAIQFITPGKPVSMAPALRTTCSVSKNTWQCSVPAALVDARIQALDKTPSYFWNLETKPGQSLNVGELALDAGASVSGWVDAAEGSQPATVHLRERIYRVAGAEERSGELTAISVIANGRGFFQFRNVPLGAYQLTATRGDSTTQEEVTLDVHQTDEYRVAESLRLIDPVPLIVRIRPALADDEASWRVTLSRALPRSSLVERVAESPAHADGTWTRVTAVGTYVLSIVDAGGAVQHSRVITVDDSLGPVDIDLERVDVRGRVLVAGEPLQGKLTFSDRQGSKVTIASDHDGSFAGTLPHDGKWTARVRPDQRAMYFAGVAVEVVRMHDGSPAPVDIEFPAGAVRGTVKDALGKGIEADIQVLREKRLMAAVASDPGGQFEIVGLETGQVELRALSDIGESVFVPANVGEDGFTKVDLIIPRQVKLGGHVRTRSGRPVSGALIRYTSPIVMDLRETTSGPSGEFHLTMPGEVALVDLVVIAGGMATAIERIQNPRRDGSFEVIVDESAGVVHIVLGGTPSWPYIGRAGALVGLPLLFPPHVGGGLPAGLSRTGYAARLAPGIYHVCPTGVMSSACKEVNLAPFTETTVDFSEATKVGSP